MISTECPSRFSTCRLKSYLRGLSLIVLGRNPGLLQVLTIHSDSIDLAACIPPLIVGFATGRRFRLAPADTIVENHSAPLGKVIAIASLLYRNHFLINVPDPHRKALS